MIRLSTALRNHILSKGYPAYLFKNARINLLSGNQPVTADCAAGKPLVVIKTKGGVESFPGYFCKNSEHEWSGIITRSGTVGWFRIELSAKDTGERDRSGKYYRMDGSVGDFGSDINLSSTKLEFNNIFTLDAFRLNAPGSLPKPEPSLSAPTAIERMINSIKKKRRRLKKWLRHWAKSRGQLTRKQIVGKGKGKGKGKKPMKPY